MDLEKERFEVLGNIGHGSFGYINKVKRKSDGKVMCRKEISYVRMSTKEREQLHSELQILKSLKHPNIVEYFEKDHVKATGHLHIYMEYCAGGDLSKHIDRLKRDRRLEDEDYVWSVLTQLVSALFVCHYNEKPPDVWGGVEDAKPRSDGLKTPKEGGRMILHRDVKPDNVFLDAGGMVKLGDFGLSKMISTHDFASTYVGTPYYMSPEVLAGEPYSLQTDIWALGCVIYELCTTKVPFHAETHPQLNRKINQGKVDQPISERYSKQLSDVISSCLRVNPKSRPDTTQLINMPIVKLKRKELEMTQRELQLKVDKDRVLRIQKQYEQKLAEIETEKLVTRSELEKSIRMEWEVKARLEIEQQVTAKVNQEVRTQLAKLQGEFEAAVEKEVATRVSERANFTYPEEPFVRSSTPEAEYVPTKNMPAWPTHNISQSTSGETDDFPSETDLSSLSLESPTLEKSKKALLKQARTPFGRAQTIAVASPMDVHMASPSPAPITNLGLSPRRARAAKIPSNLSRNIFADPFGEQSDKLPALPKVSEAESYALRESTLADFAEDLGEESDDDEDSIPSLPQTGQLSRDPFKPQIRQPRPTISRQRTEPHPKPSTLVKTKSSNQLYTKPQQPASAQGALQGKTANKSSPTRRIPKLPSAANVLDVGSPKRKPESSSPTRQKSTSNLRPVSRAKQSLEDLKKANSAMHGRTLVEIAQGRTDVKDFGDDTDSSRGSGRSDSDYQNYKNAKLDPNTTPQLVWDPEYEEMPSPFLARGKKVVRSGPIHLHGTLGGPGLQHMR